MDQIQHKYIDAKGAKLHIAEIGTGLESIFLVEKPYLLRGNKIHSLFPLLLQALLRSYSSTASQRYGTHGDTKWLLLLKPATMQLHQI